MLAINIRYSISLFSLNHHFGRKRNIIIHHGLMGSSKNFRSISKTPAFSNYCNSYLIDARNHGNSPHTNTHTLGQLADDVHQFIVQNKLDDEHNRLTLMGHSMGALALLQFTKKYASQSIQKYIDRVIIIDIPATPIKYYPNYIEMSSMLKSLVEIDLKKPKEQIFHEIDKKALSPSIAGLLKTNLNMINQKEHEWVVNLRVLASQGYHNISNFHLSTHNQKIWKQPIEVIYGEDSGYFNENEQKIFRQNFPQMKDSNFHKVPKAGHWVHFDQTKIFLQIIDKIMKQDEP